MVDPEADPLGVDNSGAADDDVDEADRDSRYATMGSNGDVMVEHDGDGEGDAEEEDGVESDDSAVMVAGGLVSVCASASVFTASWVCFCVWWW
jgi:hypothetical protein